jgi:hypothetical protein
MDDTRIHIHMLKEGIMNILELKIQNSARIHVRAF